MQNIEKSYLTFANSLFECAIDLFPKYNKAFAQHLVDLVAFNFNFNLLPPLYFLKLNRYFSTFVSALTSLIYPFIRAGSMNYFPVSKVSANRSLTSRLNARGFRVPRNNLKNI